MANRSVLITGGAGFVGSTLAFQLLQRGDSVTVLDRLHPQIHTEESLSSERMVLLRERTRFIEGDVRDPTAVSMAIEGVDTVVHLAAETGTGQSMYEIHRYVETNIGATALLLDILTNSRHSVDRFVVASSRSIYGEGRYRTRDGNFTYPESRNIGQLQNGQFEVCGSDGVPLELVPTHESSMLHPSSVYGITKQNQEQMVLTVCPTIDIAPVALRYQNVYGPGQSLSNPYTGILSIFSTLLRQGREINVFEDGLESRDFVYIDDVVSATELAVHGRGDGMALNIGSGVATSVLTVVEELARSLHVEPKFRVTGNFRIGDIRHNVADISRAREHLGYLPRWDFQRGIESFASWVLGEPVRMGSYDESLAEMRDRNLLK